MVSEEGGRWGGLWAGLEIQARFDCRAPSCSGRSPACRWTEARPDPQPQEAAGHSTMTVTCSLQQEAGPPPHTGPWSSNAQYQAFPHRIMQPSARQPLPSRDQGHLAGSQSWLGDLGAPLHQARLGMAQGLLDTEG